MRIFLCFLSFLFLGNLSGQRLKPVAENVRVYKQQIEANSYILFQSKSGLQYQSRHRQYITDQKYLEIDRKTVNDIQSSKPGYLEFEFPDELNIGKIQLYQVKIFSQGYKLRTGMGSFIPSQNNYLFYRGTIKNDPKSLAVVTFKGDEARILISKGHSNFRIHQVENGPYVFFDDKDLQMTSAYECMTEDIDIQVIHKKNKGNDRSVLSGNCVEIYFECDYKSYLDNGSSVANTESWVASLFNEVSTLYANENIPISVSEILVWDTPDIFQGLNSTGAVLDSFRRYRNVTGFNGRLGHFLSTRGLGGGIASVNVLCSNSSNYAVSTSLSTNITPFPDYSWNVNVVAHELGHNFGSPHTHSCYWNGNNTQIDDCGNQYLFNLGENYGSCFDTLAPIIPAEGSVMSYCHLSTGNGISFNIGFGLQPGDLIYNRYINASCNTGTCAVPACVQLSNPVNGAIGVSIESDISWENETGASGYRVTIGTSPTNGSITNNEDVGLTTAFDPGTMPFNTTIHVLVIPYNNLGDAISCSVQSFTTEENTQPSCTNLTNPLDGASNIGVDQDISWSEPAGFETGYKLTLGTQAGVGDILSNFDVGNVTTYDPGILPVSSTIFVRVTPYGTSGDTQGCPEESFSTNNQPVYCSSGGDNADFEWIGNFQIGSFNKDSENQEYSDFTTDTIDLMSGETYQTSITPIFSSTTYQEYFKIWIDFNKDGDFFDSGEEVFTAGPSNITVSGSTFIPGDQEEVITRMRVSMKYNSVQTACENFSFGEVEDYTVHIASGAPCTIITNTNASGQGSFLGAIDCFQPGDTILFSPDIANEVIDLTSAFAIIDESVIILADPLHNISIRGFLTDRVFDIRNGAAVKIGGLKIISGLSENASAILNAGNLILEDVEIIPHSSLSPNAILIDNTGTLGIQNRLDVKPGN